MLSDVDQAIKGATLNKSKIRKIRVFYPDLLEQQKIAQILSTLDRALEQTEALIAKYERVKRGLMQDLLTRGIDEAGRLRSEATHEFKDSVLGRIPLEWEVKPFGELVESSMFGPRFPAGAYSSTGKLAMLRTTDLNRAGDVISAELPLAAIEPSTLALHLLERGDLLITRSGTIGITSVFESYKVPVVPAAFLIRFRLNKKGNPRFYKLFFNSEQGQTLIQNNAAGGVLKNLKGSSVLRLLVPHLSTAEQQRILDFLTRQDALIKDLQRQFEKYQTLKTGLMQDLLTGKVSVAPLLERPKSPPPTEKTFVAPSLESTRTRPTRTLEESHD